MFSLLASRVGPRARQPRGFRDERQRRESRRLHRESRKLVQLQSMFTVNGYTRGSVRRYTVAHISDSESCIGLNGEIEGGYRRYPRVRHADPLERMKDVRSKVDP